MINSYHISSQKRNDFLSIIWILARVLLQHSYGPDIDFEMLNYQYLYINFYKLWQ